MNQTQPHQPCPPYPPYPPKVSRVMAIAILIVTMTSVSAQVRLTDASDRTAFRSWFTLLADLQFDRPATEVTDCAALVRFAYREALRAHTPEWARRLARPFTPTFPDVRSGPKPTPAGWPLFRTGPGDPGRFARFAEFADARTLIALNSRSRGRDTAALEPGDLLYFRQPGQSQPDHLMVFVGRSFFDRLHDDWVVYHTGPTGEDPGEVRKVRLADLLTYPGGYYQEPTRTEVGRSEVTTAGEGSASAALSLPPFGGSYRLRVSASAGDRDVSTEAFLWVAGAEDPSSGDGDRYLELIADRRTYRPGDVARLALRGDSVAGPMLVTKEGQQVTWHQVLRSGTGEPIEVPILEGDSGDIYVHIAIMRDGRLYRAERRLAVPPTERALTITLTADRPVAKPQEPGVFSVSVVDAAGVPVNAQVSLGVIDEAVYAICQDDTPDPLRFFYRREYSRVGTAFSRDYYFTGFSGSERLQLATRRRRPFTLADFKGDKEVQPQVRQEFPDAIYWLGDLVTDAQGQAKVSIKHPDALTTWRLTARAVTPDTKTGVAIARTTTTKDLIVRVITPRFLTEGDEVVLPTVAHNYLPASKDTTVFMAVKGLEPVATPSPTSGVIDSGAERRDDWRWRATTVNNAVVTASARTNADRDAVELPIPVLPYGLRREIGQSGTLLADGPHETEVTIPAASNPAARTVSVSLAPSMAGSLLGALDFLASFPYGCTEQTLSSFLPNVLVTRALAQLKLVPTERLSVLDRQVATGLRRLADYQHDDGGWGWWRMDDNYPFMTAYALFGLAEARRTGYQVEDYRMQNGAFALATMYAECPNATPDLKAYMAYVLNLAAPGADGLRTYRHDNALNELWDARARMSSHGRAFLLLTLDARQDSRGNQLADALTGEAQHRGELTWWAADRDPLLFDLVDTSVEATALALQALARHDPANPVIDRAVRWLMLNRRGGY